MNKTLVIGAAGQIGTELVEELRARRGVDQVIASDIQIKNLLTPCYELDATDPDKVRKIIQQEGISEVYNLVATLSAKGEKEPQKAALSSYLHSVLHILLCTAMSLSWAVHTINVCFAAK